MKSIAIDLDGTLAKYTGFKGIDVIGNPMPGAREFVEKLSKKAKIVIHTCRISDGGKEFCEDTPVQERVEIIKKWLESHGIPFDRIHTEEGKPYACAYVDDRAVVVHRRYEGPKGKEEYERAYKECLELIKENTE